MAQSNATDETAAHLVLARAKLGELPEGEVRNNLAKALAKLDAAVARRGEAKEGGSSQPGGSAVGKVPSVGKPRGRPPKGMTWDDEGRKWVPNGGQISAEAMKAKSSKPRGRPPKGKTWCEATKAWVPLDGAEAEGG